MLRFDGSNFTGIFWFQRGTNKKLLYCITNKGEKVGNPITSPLWEKKVREAEQGMARENRQTATELLDPDNNATTTDEPLAEPTGQSDVANQKGAANQSGESSSDIPDAKRVKRQTAAEEIASQSYWLSVEAICLFAPKGNETADEALEQIIEILGWATGSNEGWCEIVKGHDPDNLCSDNDIFELRQRCMLLKQTYRIALCVFHQYLLPSKTWVGPNGERPLLPKTNGEAYMVSGLRQDFLGSSQSLRQHNYELSTSAELWKALPRQGSCTCCK